MEITTPQPAIQPAPPTPFNGWAAYGWLWVFTVVRMLQRTVLDRETEIAWHIEERNADRAAHRAEVAELTRAHNEAIAELRAERDAEIGRLRDENRMLLNRLLKRQSTEALPELNQEPNPNGSGHQVTRLQYKSPIASHNAAMKALELSGGRGRLVSEEERRAAIRADAEAAQNGAGEQ